ncbi:MAG: hypothetical protein MJ178_07010 [Treponemataceae bacterium]|nr:hypothetical protein [Treponemataceae bacterium]
MNMKKSLLTLAAALLLAGTVTAQQTNTHWTTAGTMYADGDKFMDVNRWQDSDFASALLFTDLKMNSITMGYATKTMFPVYAGIFYNGKTWEDNATNTISVIVGKDSMAGKITFTTGPKSLAGENVDTIHMALDFGMNNVSDNIDVHGGVSFGTASTSNETTVAGTTRKTETGNTVLGISGGARIPLEVKGTAKVAAVIDAGYTADTTTTTESSGSNASTGKLNNRVIFITPTVTVDYALTSVFAYGLKVSVPFVFADTITSTGSGSDTVSHNHYISPVIRNGISGDLVANKLKLNAGVTTNLPAIDMDDDKNTSTSLSNTYYAGCVLKLGDNVDIDTGASIMKASATSGYATESLDDLWKTSMYFTVSVKF